MNGINYGNKWKQRTINKSEWDTLPDTQTKHEILYIDCIVVQIFKKSGFDWGGDYTTTKDGMHFSWIGDKSRSVGIANSQKYGGLPQ